MADVLCVLFNQRTDTYPERGANHSHQFTRTACVPSSPEAVSLPLPQYDQNVNQSNDSEACVPNARLRQ